jgi:hypothetical protein
MGILGLIRRWRNTSAQFVGLSSEGASTFLRQLVHDGQFAVFTLPERSAFVQAIRTPSGGLVIEISRRTPALEALLGRLGSVTTNELGFLTMSSRAGDETTCAQVIAQGLELLAASSGCQNVCRVLRGAQ